MTTPILKMLGRVNTEHVTKAELLGFFETNFVQRFEIKEENNYDLHALDFLKRTLNESLAYIKLIDLAVESDIIQKPSVVNDSLPSTFSFRKDTLTTDLCLTLSHFKDLPFYLKLDKIRIQLVNFLAEVENRIQFYNQSVTMSERMKCINLIKDMSSESFKAMVLEQLEEIVNDDQVEHEDNMFFIKNICMY